MGKYLLSIDAGTQSLRAMVFDAGGGVVAGEKVVYPQAYFSVRPGFVEKEAEDYWEALVEACRGVWSQGVSPGDILSLCITTQRATTVLLDGDGRPVRPAVLWLDQRQASRIPAMGLYRLLFGLAGAWEAVRYFQRRALVNWVREKEPLVWERTRHVTFLSGYLNYRLTGELVDSTASQVGYLPFDFKGQKWEREGHWKYRAVPVDPGMLPLLRKPGDILGEVGEDAARATGLLAGTPVISGASDKACEILGCGVVNPEQACLGYGTTATISVNTPRYFEPMRFSPAYPSAIPGQYNVEYQVFRGFWLVTWFKEQFARIESEKARAMGMKPEELLEELAREVPAGSHGLVLQPFWTPGIKYPGLNAKGCMVGFSDVHKKEHIYRAIIEGLIFALREGKEMLEKRGRLAIRELYIAGGGASSPLVAQCTADIMNLPVVRPRHHETSALGAAILSSVAIGVYQGIHEALKSMTGRGETFEPRADNVRIYQALYTRVFKRLFRRLRDVYREVDAIFHQGEGEGQPSTAGPKIDGRRDGV